MSAKTTLPNFIVGIGGGAGALDGYKALLGALPPNTGMAFAIVSNIHFTASSQLAQILSKHTKMPVLLASEAMPFKKVAAPRSKRNGQIDSTFISLAEAMGTPAIGIIVSGDSGDGIEGCKHIKDSGGKTIAQDMSGEADGIPLSPQVASVFDFILRPEKIPNALRGLAKILAPVKTRGFDPKTFLATIGVGRRNVVFPKGKTTYTQGEEANSVFYIQKGSVRLTVIAENGKEATIGIMNQGDFCGEGGLAGQALRMGSAMAMTDCELMRIEKKAMVIALRREHKLSHVFTLYLLGRNIRYEADLVDQIFSSSGKRLARILLLLSNFGKEGAPTTTVSRISQATLAEMIGATRSRVNFFMNKFRKLGYIHYNGGLTVHSSLLSVIVHEKTE